MSQLIILFVLTVLIAWVQFKTWKVEKNIIFPIFTAIFYFWSLAGAWLFIFDVLSGFGKSIGLNYYYLLEKMFPVKLDNWYSLTLIIYGVFILLFQGVCYFGLKKLKQSMQETHSLQNSPVLLKSFPIVLITISCLILSFWIVKDVFIYSLLLDESVYINIRSTQMHYYSIHQYLNWTMIVSLYIYVGLFLSRGSSFYTVEKPGIVFWLTFIIANCYLIMIGSRHETFFAGILALLIISFPHRSIRSSWKVYLLFFIVFGGTIVLNDPMRSLMPAVSKKIGITESLKNEQRTRKANLYLHDRTFVYHQSEEKSKEIIFIASQRDTTLYLKKDTITMKLKELYRQIELHSNYLELDGRKIKLPNPHVSHAYYDFTMFQKITKAVTTIVFSNELFAGHFSMYGIAKQNVKPKIGISFIYVAKTLKPGSSKDTQVLDSYTYYSNAMKFPDKQGFTINHVSGWYLNFGYLGILLGACVLSCLLLTPYYFYLKVKVSVVKLILFVVFLSIGAFGAMLVRSGPEAFKGLITEAVIIPIFIVLTLYFYQRFYFHFKMDKIKLFKKSATQKDQL